MCGADQVLTDVDYGLITTLLVVSTITVTLSVIRAARIFLWLCSSAARAYTHPNALPLPFTTSPTGSPSSTSLSISASSTPFMRILSFSIQVKPLLAVLLACFGNMSLLIFCVLELSFVNCEFRYTYASFPLSIGVVTFLNLRVYCSVLLFQITLAADAWTSASSSPSAQHTLQWVRSMFRFVSWFNPSAYTANLIMWLLIPFSGQSMQGTLIWVTFTWLCVLSVSTGIAMFYAVSKTMNIVRYELAPLSDSELEEHSKRSEVMGRLIKFRRSLLGTVLNCTMALTTLGVPYLFDNLTVTMTVAGLMLSMTMTIPVLHLKVAGMDDTRVAAATGSRVLSPSGSAGRQVEGRRTVLSPVRRLSALSYNGTAGSIAARATAGRGSLMKETVTATARDRAESAEPRGIQPLLLSPKSDAAESEGAPEQPTTISMLEDPGAGTPLPSTQPQTGMTAADQQQLLQLNLQIQEVHATG